MARRSTVLTGAAGEHFVMYRLLSQGRLAALAPHGAEGIDILVCDTHGNRLAAIQVKTAGSKVTIGWQMKARHELLRDDWLFYVFVDPGSTGELPACWIVPSAVVADHVYVTHRAWLAGMPRRGDTRSDGDGRKMHLKCGNPSLEAYPDGWMNRYREAWHLLDGVTAR